MKIILLIILFNISWALEKTDCFYKEPCSCLFVPFSYSEIFTYTCSVGQENFMLEIIKQPDNNTIQLTTLKCKNMETFNEKLIPEISVGATLTVEFVFCPEPEDKFQSVLRKLNITIMNSISVQPKDLKRFDLLSFSNYLQNVSNFGIENTNMTYLSENSTKYMDEIRLLKLSKNHISEIGENTFSKMHKIKHLYLDYNNLTKLEENTFSELQSLETLLLGFNQLEYVNVNLFSTLNKLTQLFLNNNKLKLIHPKTFQNQKQLHQLSLGFNLLTKESVLMKTFLGLDKLKILELHNNKIEEIGVDSFYYLTELENLYIFDNGIKVLQRDMFRNNIKLEEVFLQKNSNLTLRDYTFSNLPKLMQIDMTNCSLPELTENLFKNSNKIKTLSIDSNRIKVLDTLLFTDKTEINYLYLGKNNIENLHPDIFINLVNLKNLELQKNSIKFLPENIFSNLTSLLELDLSWNNLEYLEDNLFQFTVALQILKLENNKLKIIKSTHFNRLPHVWMLNLDDNKIVNVSDSAFYNMRLLSDLKMAGNFYTGPIKYLVLSDNVRTADFSRNLLKEIPYLTYSPFFTLLNLSHNIIENIQSFTIEPNFKEVVTYDLSYNKIRIIDFKNIIKSKWNTPLKSILTGNPLRCNCLNYELLEFINKSDRKLQTLIIQIENFVCQGPENHGVAMQKLKPEMLTCSIQIRNEPDIGIKNNSCPDKCICLWRPSDKYFVINCSNQSLLITPSYRVPEKILIRNITFPLINIELNLTHNLLTEVKVNDTKVKRLFLSYNNIQHVWIPKQIKILHLDNNNLRKINEKQQNFLRKLPTLENLTLGDNPWECTCETYTFQEFLFSMEKKIDTKSVLCAIDQQPIVQNKNLCFSRNLVYIFASVFIFCVVLIITILIALYYKYTLEIKVWLFAHNVCSWFFNEEELDDKEYDVFVSYSSRDEDYVIHTLLPILERQPNPYAVNLHLRSFIPGEFITKNIITAVNCSRRTLVVLSNNFLESVWGKMEFRTAHTKALSDGTSRVIIVIYGEFDEARLDDELRAYMSTNTYIKWDDPRFVNKLRYALPHAKFREILSRDGTENIEMRI
ncbi:unnamed protein product [Brassicogethes aeneus]|uniref:TIR domain-containing protein n=1 Tax=Brassicogethes aeneus TaxID=1431903 RepID=A0A9P0B2Y4_BRAAE|nr:unnamed protein product [Brassicogethes aeneus]